MPSPTATAELASQLRASVTRLARRLRYERPDTALPLTHLATLGILERHGSLSPGELATHERVQPPSMTRVLAALEDRGLVSRHPHPTDGRQVVVELTPAAHDLLAEDRRRREAWLSLRLSELTIEERATLRAATEIFDRLVRG